MSEEEKVPKTPFTKSEVKYSPMYEHYGTLYPVLDIHPGAFHSLVVSFRRAISSINPFAHQQIPSSDRVALGIRDGNSFYTPDSYVNGVVFDLGYPSHYDPLKHPRREKAASHKFKYSVPDSLPGWVALPYPRGCKRQIQLFEQCVYANGREKCGEEGTNILSICPNFVLDGLRQRTLQKAKVLAIDNATYREAMTVGDYNKGRSVANISTNSWIDGKAEKLRPDTMWADDRYVDITQKEINEAKARIAERKARNAKHHHDDHKHGHDDHSHEYDWKKVSLVHEPALYP